MTVEGYFRRVTKQPVKQPSPQGIIAGYMETFQGVSGLGASES